MYGYITIHIWYNKEEIQILGGRNMRKSIKILISAVFLVASTNFAVNAQNSDLIEKYFKKSHNEVKGDLEYLSKSKLVEELDLSVEISDEVEDINLLIPYATEILNRINEFDNTEIINYIKDKEIQPYTKEIFADLYIIKNQEAHDVSYDDLEILLNNKDIEDSVKQRIIINGRFEKKDVNLLKEFIQKGDLTAFYALKQLSKVDNSEAYNISTDILLDYNNKSEYEISSACSSIAGYLRYNDKIGLYKENEEKNFLDTCLNIFNVTDNVTIRDSIAFSISEIQSEQSIKYLLTNFNLDREIKAFVIDQNYIALKTILNNNPTDEDINMVIEAMGILPIKDLVKELDESIEKTSNESIRLKGENIIKYMNEEGREANEKWIVE